MSPLRGRELLHDIVGQRLQRGRRCVLDLGGANDELGHGITELIFDRTVLHVRTGPNEDHVLVVAGSAQLTSLERTHFSQVELAGVAEWIPIGREVVGVDLFSDGLEDTALRFRFDDDRALVIALVDTDLVLAPDLRVFEAAGEAPPVLRETLP